MAEKTTEKTAERKGTPEKPYVVLATRYVKTVSAPNEPYTGDRYNEGQIVELVPHEAKRLKDIGAIRDLDDEERKRYEARKKREQQELERI